MSIDQCLHSLFGASKAGRRRAGPGVRPLLRPEDGHLPRRLPHRARPLRRRAARIPRLPREVRRHRRALHDLSATRASRCATTSTPSTSCEAFWHFFRSAAPGRGLQHRRQPLLELLDARGHPDLGSSSAAGRARDRYDEHPRTGDHIWWISDVRKFQRHYPDWSYRYDLHGILREIHAGAQRATPASADRPRRA